MRNLLLIISGPSGVGKGTIVKELIKSGKYSLSVSCTTRSPRAGEVDGREYFFITREKFMQMIADGGFIEYNNHFGNYYGTPKGFVDEKLKTDDVILEIEVNGALKVKTTHPEAILIMILPPDRDELRARLVGRNSESEENIEERLKRMDYEVSLEDKYDYIVINDDLATAVKNIEEIIEREKEQEI